MRFNIQLDACLAALQGLVRMYADAAGQVLWCGVGSEAKLEFAPSG